MDILRERDLIGEIKKGGLISSPLPPAQIHENSIYLTLSNTWEQQFPNDRNTRHMGSRLSYDMPTSRIVQQKHQYADVINPTKDMVRVGGVFDTYDIDGESKDAYIVDPGQFILFFSNEVINIPKGILGSAIGRSPVAGLSVQIGQSGLFDPGFKGQVTLEIQNQTNFPIILFTKMKIAQMWFTYIRETATEIGIHEDFRPPVNS